MNRSDLFGAAIRLAFHDAGEVDIRAPDHFGPDGCLSGDANNNGLVEFDSLVTTVMEPIWQTVCDNISRADFWVLFGKLVLEFAASVPININYQYGRVDTVSCNGGRGRLPTAQGDLDEITRVFVTQMGLTMNDAGIVG